MTLRNMGRMFVSHTPYLRPIARRIYNALPRRFQDTIAARLERHLRKQADVYLIQIGAFDGIRDDPVHQLLLDCTNWKAVLVEPQPEVFARLAGNYRAFADRITCKKCAVGRSAAKLRDLYFISGDTIREYRIRDYAPLLASFQKAHLEGHFPGVPISSIRVPVQSITEIAAEAGFPHIDALVIDAEGSEAEILREVEFNRYRIQCVVFEYIHLTPPVLEELNDLLTGLGFKIERLEMDVFASRTLL